MRITFITSPFDLGGGQRVIATYAERLRRRGHQVLVLAPPHRQPTVKDKIRSLLRQRRWPKPPSTESHFDRVAVERRTVAHPGPIVDADVPDADVVLATWWETAEWVAALSPSKGAKAYFIQHHEVFEPLPVERVEATWRLPLHKITISKWLVDLARERFGDDHVDLIHNSVDQELFHSPPRGRQARPTIGMMYATHPWKGCDISLKAIELVAKRMTNLEFLVFGHGAVSSHLPLPPQSTYWQQPRQELIREIYSRCDLWICGSRTEGFHLPPLEAMACRCPVVSSRVGGPVDVIRDGVNGYLVDIADPEAMANRILKVLEMPEQEWIKMSNAALATATCYTWDDATDLFEKVLTRLDGAR